MRRKLLYLDRRIERFLFLDLLGGIAGVIGGLGAIVFRLMIKFNHWIFFDVVLPRLSNTPLGNWSIALLPALGGLIIGPIIMRLAPETKGHGVPEVMEAVALKGGKIRKRVAFIKILVSSVTIGSGGSAGREGPIAQIGASFGSLLGDIFKLRPNEVKLLVVCGLSAGIAGTFNAPLGGALFGMEVLYREIELMSAVPIVLASVIGAAVASAYLGLKPSFIVPSDYVFTNPAELVWYLILGIVFGFLAVIWVKLFYAIEDLFEELRVPNELKPAIGGLIVGMIGVYLGKYGIMGVGYEGVDMALNGQFNIMLLFILGLFKMIATAFTIGSGGSGGIFAPSLYIGAMFGGVLGVLFHRMAPWMVRRPFMYCLAGMAALFAGAAQAPLNVIIMIPEMANDYSLIPPLMVCSAMSFIIARLFMRGSSIYTLKLERRGIRIKVGGLLLLENVRVEEIMTREVIYVHPDMNLAEVEEIMERSYYHGYPVVEDGKLIGIITFEDIAKVPREKRHKVKVKDILKDKVIVTYPDESVQEALNKMYKYKIGRLPVVDRENPKRLLGIITRSDILNAYKIAIRRMSTAI